MVSAMLVHYRGGQWEVASLPLDHPEALVHTLREPLLSPYQQVGTYPPACQEFDVSAKVKALEMWAS